MKDSSEDESSARGAGSSPRWVALAGIAGTLIGALGGVAGSILVYQQNEDTQKHAREERRSDIRRKSYVDLVAEFQTWEIKANGVSNIIDAAIVEKDDKIKLAHTQEALDEYNKGFISAHSRSRQTEVAVILVGTKGAGDIARKLSTAREKVALQLFNAFQGDEPYIGDKYVEAIQECEDLIEKFLSKVKREVVV
ncbi:MULTISPECIES: hypothetical protein [unclassified Streptomyces]|uniref:hypothetical protein n=1 Tax=unclassified Streptomyces TaxID=2593676 RepID=UPI002E2AB280|nr:hypothetical protein [Streptomyces sp. NBC_01439]